ncbi:hypothetical protein Pmar_PMAR027120, partial [Perkinsus marinus ATCC 50983]
VNSFELYGFDVIFDESLRAWLLEVNSSPSMNLDTLLDERIKVALIRYGTSIFGIRWSIPLGKLIVWTYNSILSLLQNGTVSVLEAFNVVTQQRGFG